MLSLFTRLSLDRDPKDHPKTISPPRTAAHGSAVHDTRRPIPAQRRPERPKIPIANREPPGEIDSESPPPGGPETRAEGEQRRTPGSPPVPAPARRETHAAAAAGELQGFGATTLERGRLAGGTPHRRGAQGIQQVIDSK